MISSSVQTDILSHPDALLNNASEYTEKSHTVARDLSRAIDIPAGTLATKSWTFDDDPWKFVGNSGSDLGQISDISLALTRVATGSFPNFDLRSVIAYDKTSLGWRTSDGGMKLTINYKTSAGAIIYSYVIALPTFPPPPHEILIRCGDNNRFYSHTHKLEVDLYNDISGASLQVDASTWYKC
jgi:hypothetical protein